MPCFDLENCRNMLLPPQIIKFHFTWKLSTYGVLTKFIKGFVVFQHDLKEYNTIVDAF